MTASAARQVRLSTSSTGSLVTGSAKSDAVPWSSQHDAHGKRFHIESPRIAAACLAWSMRSAGMSQLNAAGFTTPVRESSTRSRICLAIRNEEGTTPPASPECTPSSMTFTSSVPFTSPRSEVVTQSCS